MVSCNAFSNLTHSNGETRYSLNTNKSKSNASEFGKLPGGKAGLKAGSLEKADSCMLSELQPEIQILIGVFFVVDILKQSKQTLFIEFHRIDFEIRVHQFRFIFQGADDRSLS